MTDLTDLTPDEIVGELTMLVNDELVTLAHYLDTLMESVPPTTESVKFLAAKLTTVTCLLRTTDLDHLVSESKIGTKCLIKFQQEFDI